MKKLILLSLIIVVCIVGACTKQKYKKDCLENDTVMLEFYLKDKNKTGSIAYNKDGKEEQFYFTGSKKQYIELKNDPQVAVTVAVFTSDPPRNLEYIRDFRLSNDYNTCGIYPIEL